MPAFVASDLTVAVTDRTIVGLKRRVRGTLTFGNGALTYPTGGIPLPTFEKWGFVRNVDDVHITGVNGLTTDYLTRYDRANHKLQLFEEEGVAAAGPLLECDVAEAPVARTYYFEAVGW